MSKEIDEIRERIRPRAELGKQQLKKEAIKTFHKYNSGRKARRRRR